MSWSWIPFDNGTTIGAPGSEDGGTMLRDDEYVSDEFGAAARISLERDGWSPFSVTCGIYGWMAHTRFFSIRDDADIEYEKMKIALADLVDLIPLQNDPDGKTKIHSLEDEIENFVMERFP